MDFPPTLVLMRHSTTAGNLAGQYIGRTDQPLCRQGIELAQATARIMPQVERVYCSPMLRCRQTAEILYPCHIAYRVAALRETDFGLFEGKTHAGLATDPDYRAWIASAGALPPPGGEGATAFLQRCIKAFFNILHELARNNIASAACVLHGGSIMAIMTELAAPERPFYDWRVGNCCGFVVAADCKLGRLTLLEELGITREI